MKKSSAVTLYGVSTSRSRVYPYYLQQLTILAWVIWDIWTLGTGPQFAMTFPYMRLTFCIIFLGLILLAYIWKKNKMSRHLIGWCLLITFINFVAML